MKALLALLAGPWSGPVLGAGLLAAAGFFGLWWLTARDQAHVAEGRTLERLACTAEAAAANEARAAATIALEARVAASDAAQRAAADALRIEREAARKDAAVKTETIIREVLDDTPELAACLYDRGVADRVNSLRR